MTLKKNTLWGIAGGGIPMAAAVISIPYLLKHLGNGGFGVLTLIWALIGYFSLFDMGIGRALTYQVGAMLSIRSRSEVSSVVCAGVLLAAATGAIGATVMYLLAQRLAENWLGIDEAMLQDSIKAFKVTAVGVLLATTSSALRGALEGYGKFAASNINKIASGFFTFILPAISISLHGNSLWLISTYLVAGRLVTSIGMALQLRTDFLAQNIRLKRTQLAELLSFGSWVTVSGIIGPLMIYGDRFLVGASIGTSQLPYYAIPQEGLQRLLIIPAALCAALLPALSALGSRDSLVLYRTNFGRIIKYAAIYCIVAALLSYPALYILFSKEFSITAGPIAIVLTIGIFLNSIAFLPYTFLHSRGMPKITALMHVVELIFYIFILWFLTKYFGLIGAAVAWTTRVALDLILLLIAVRWIRSKDQ